MLHSSWHLDRPWAQLGSAADLESTAGQAPIQIAGQAQPAHPHLDAQLLTERPQPINALLIPLVPAAPNQFQL